jgi:hypothetical protein
MRAERSEVRRVLWGASLSQVRRVPFERTQGTKASDSHLSVTPGSIRELSGDRRRQ